VQSQVLDRVTFGSAADATSVSTGTTQATVFPDELLLASVSLNATRTFQDTWTNGFSQRIDTRRQTVAERITSASGQFQTAESWASTVGSAVGTLVTFKGFPPPPPQPEPEPDPNPGSATDTFTWTIGGAGGPGAPVIDSVTIDQAAPRTNDVLSATIVASDPEGDPITLSYRWLKNGSVLAGATDPSLDLSGAGIGEKGDQFALRVTATDGTAISLSATSPAVTVANTPPVFDQDLGDATNTVGDVVSVSAAASDADGDQPTYEAANLPAGLTINASTGLISGTIAAGAQTGSPYAVSITVRDGPTVDATDTLTWTVNPLPPPAPTGFSATATSIDVRLAWTGGPGIAGFNVYRGAAAAGPFTQLNGALLTSPSFTDTTAPRGTSHYRVTAVGTSGLESAPALASATRTILFRTATTASGANQSNLIVNVPSGTTTGDLLIAAVNIRTIRTISTPAGWTLIRTTTRTNNLRQAVYYRVATASQPASYTWTFSGTVTGTAGTILRYEGASTTSPIVTHSGRTNGSSTSILTSSISPNVSNTMLVGLFGIRNGATVNPPTGMLEQTEAAQRTGATTTMVVLQASDQVRPQTGNTGTRTATASSAAVGVGQLLALRPAP
jgi:Putative Ig domain